MNDFVSKIDDKKYSIKFLDESRLVLNEIEYNYSIKLLSSDNFILTLNNRTFICTVVENKNSNFEIVVNGELHKVISHSLISYKAEELLKSKNQSHSSGMTVKAPMPGLILKIKKQNGDYVERGETVMILEAMKMENEIRAPISGTVTFNSIKEGTSVEKNIKLFEIR
ncbi:MAG: acetyl-CoA carboxylase biotin carboxyl carrier protein subunit [Ignavibacterium sp.]|jgi:biotin carboxyl carrier protein|uniref:acetyl-CoA carboxylase biotin carboxyl carrier protein subunit n=1 Tax=Ignavibacterium sp. TaxID=2651167 RepID=UPI003297DE2D